MSITRSPDTDAETTDNLIRPPNYDLPPIIPGPILAVPIITGLSPASGPTTGGTTLSISGANFELGATVRVGNSAAMVTGFSSSRIEVRTPPGPLGPTVVTVTGPSGQTAAIAGAFSYVVQLPSGDPPPVITPPDVPPPPGGGGGVETGTSSLEIRPDRSVVQITAGETKRVGIQLLRTRLPEEVLFLQTQGSVRAGEVRVAVVPGRTTGNRAELVVDAPLDASISKEVSVDAIVPTRNLVLISPGTVRIEVTPAGQLSFRDNAAVLTPGQSGTYELFVFIVGRSFPPLTLSAQSAFSNVRFSRSTLTPDQISATVTVTAAQNMPAGVYPLTVTARGAGEGPYVGQLPITVRNVAASLLRISNPNLSYTEGGSATAFITLEGDDVTCDLLATTTGPVAVSFSGRLSKTTPVAMRVSGGNAGSLRITVRSSLGDNVVLPVEATLSIRARISGGPFPEVPDDDPEV